LFVNEFTRGDRGFDLARAALLIAAEDEASDKDGMKQNLTNLQRQISMLN
jgi:hypothetical protein